MGIENRDYYRQNNQGSFLGGDEAPVCKKLLIANIVVFVLQIFISRPIAPADLENFSPRGMPRVSIVQEWLQLDTTKVLHGQVWRLLSSAFCHDRDSVFHIVFNMLFLWWFGKTLEVMYGSREFLTFYLTAAVLASLAYMALDIFTDAMAPAIGASGAVMAVVMLYAHHYPHDRIYLFMVVSTPIWFVVLMYTVFDLHPVLLALSGQAAGDGVAHAAHLGGLAFGAVYYRWNLRLVPYLDRVPWGRIRQQMPFKLRTLGRSSNLRVVAFEQDVDEILAKIHVSGLGSLTEDEREILEKASKMLRKRR